MHVDLVRNDFHECVQRRVAVLSDGGVEVKQEWLDHASEVSLPGVVYSTDLGRNVNPSEAASYLAALRCGIQDSHLIATSPHDPSECPFDGADTVEFGPPVSYSPAGRS